MNNLNKKIGIILLVIACLSFIFAIVCFSMSPNNISGRHEDDMKYGGDAYTGIQNAAAQTANNVYYLNQNLATLTNHITNIAGFVFILISVLCGGFGYIKYTDSKKPCSTKKESIATDSTISSTCERITLQPDEKKCWACGKIQPKTNRFCSNCSEEI